MTGSNDTMDQVDTQVEGDSPEIAPPSPRLPFHREVIAHIRNSGRIGKIAALIAAAAIIGGAYVVGGAPATDGQTLDSVNAPIAGPASAPLAGAVPAASAGLAALTPQDLSGGGTGAGVPAGTKTTESGTNAAVADVNTQIVKTGQMTLEVTDIDAALNRATTIITGMGGLVYQSNRSGTGDSAVASLTFRFPVARWDAALPALRKVGSKVLYEQTGSTDVTSQVIDLNARLDNLKTTEAALQAIMARAAAIPDVIAVETQLSDTQGQIEQLTAQRDHLANQAAMSTLTVTFQLPQKTVTTIATQDWTLGNQVDEAAAAMVRIGQGLATIVVWVAIVVLPIGLAGLLLFGIAKLTRRILGRGSRNAAAQA
jgi:hypothetical protein